MTLRQGSGTEKPIADARAKGVVFHVEYRGFPNSPVAR